MSLSVRLRLHFHGSWLKRRAPVPQVTVLMGG
jgi:hypothetical protein